MQRRVSGCADEANVQVFFIQRPCSAMFAPKHTLNRKFASGTPAIVFCMACPQFRRNPASGLVNQRIDARVLKCRCKPCLGKNFQTDDQICVYILPSRLANHGCCCRKAQCYRCPPCNGDLEQDGSCAMWCAPPMFHTTLVQLCSG